jgi:hypothetical protein
MTTFDRFIERRCGRVINCKYKCVVTVAKNIYLLSMRLYQFVRWVGIVIIDIKNEQI